MLLKACKVVCACTFVLHDNENASGGAMQSVCVYARAHMMYEFPGSDQDNCYKKICSIH